MKKCHWCSDYTNTFYTGGWHYSRVLDEYFSSWDDRDRWGMEPSYTDCEGYYKWRYCYCGMKCKTEALNSGVDSDVNAPKPEPIIHKGSKEKVSSSSSSSSEEGKWWEYVLGLLILIALCWGGWRGYKWLFGERGGGVITEAEIMEKWEEHLEKRREAFDDGKPEREIEEKGLRNYTWDEWKERFKKELEAQEKEEGPGTTRAQEIGEQALSTAKEVGGKAKSLWQDFTSNSMVDLWRERQNKRRELLGQGAGTDEIEKMGYDDLTFDEFKARYKDKDVEAEMKILNARAEEYIKERKNAAQQRTVPAVTRPEKPIASTKPATVPGSSSVRNEAMVRTKADAAANAKSAIEAAKAAAEGAVSGQQNGTGQKASKDSKSIRTVVQGKGKTKEAALHYAFRRAVWNTVGTWVGSKTRIEENRAQVIALVETITEADIRKYEVMETKQQDGNIFVKVRVSVSKKQIAPKFAKVFPDVFANE